MTKGKGNKRRFDESHSRNIQTLNFYRMRLRMLCKSMFEWKGLPEGIDSQFIENNLYHYGKLIFFKHPTLNYIVSKVNDSGDINIYERPIIYNAFSPKFNINVKAKDCVIIRNNIEEAPTTLFTEYYISQLYNLDRSIDTNISLQKFPAIVGCTEEQKQSIINMMNMYEGNQPIIFTNKNGVDLEQLKCIDFKVPFVADKMEAMKDKKWQDCLNTLGINNGNTQKKERLVSDEVNSNNQFVKLSLDVFLFTRQQACEEINKMFPDLPEKVSVEIREGFNLDLSINGGGQDGGLDD